MKMTREKKNDFVSGFKNRLATSSNVYVTDFTGLTVKNMTDLRRRFQDEGVEYVVVKNTLALRALHEVSIDSLDDVLAGPTGFVFYGAEPVLAARVLADFRKEIGDKPVVKAGLMDGERVTPAEIQRLASLPTRAELMSQAAGALQGPLQGFVGVLSGLLNQFVGVVEAFRVQRADAS